jgi:hypothetical protein
MMGRMLMKVCCFPVSLDQQGCKMYYSVRSLLLMAWFNLGCQQQQQRQQQQQQQQQHSNIASYLFVVGLGFVTDLEMMTKNLQVLAVEHPHQEIIGCGLDSGTPPKGNQLSANLLLLLLLFGCSQFDSSTVVYSNFYVKWSGYKRGEVGRLASNDGNTNKNKAVSATKT